LALVAYSQIAGFYELFFVVWLIWAILGDDWALVYWTDDFLVICIEHLISNYNLFVQLFLLFVAIHSLVAGETTFYKGMAVSYWLL